MRAQPGPENQPVSRVQWVPRDTLHANDYNPNKVAPPEMKLLATSILEDGWTQPIVAREDSEIVDGFHRWTVSGYDTVSQLTRTPEGSILVPVVRITPDPAHQRMSTIRHNRARGSHHVLRMADIVIELVEMGLTEREIGQRLSMEPEEVMRLLERGQVMKHAAAEGMTEAWRPAPHR